ncbi:MAG TPA: hypothetical protein VFM27_13100 [Acidimicrobiales bacterium]|nr:hypothetical protein [Acidimicrobiales bacterium]
MCAACFAQGAVYAGGALAALQVMAARARHRTGADAGGSQAADPETVRDPESKVYPRPSG